ncbi:MAG: magnesium chelatase, partial [Bacteroidia bacterium]|nr:magnesium chelatase [Bacteroidia bacterium]
MEEGQEQSQQNAQDQPANEPAQQAPEIPLEFSSRIDLKGLEEAVKRIKGELGKVIVGQEEMLEMLVVSI